MTVEAWRARCAAIHRSASAEGFDMTRFVRIATVLDPHDRHVGRRFDALVPARMAERRIEDVAVPLTRGDWSAPTELIEAQTLARRQVLAEIIRNDGDVDTQMAMLVAAFVHSHVTTSNRRRYAWPLDASRELVSVAMEHAIGRGVDMLLPVEGAYALMGTSHMCRAAPEPYCDDMASLDRSVGRHVAMSFRETILLSISIEAGGSVPVAAPPADTRAFLAIGKEELVRLVENEGLNALCLRYGMKPRDVTMTCRRRGIDPALLAA